MTDETHVVLSARLTKKDYIEQARGLAKQKELHFLDRAREHFRSRQQILHEISMSRSWDDWTNHNLCLISYGWDNVRKLVLWSYGVNSIRHLPDDRQDEINDFAVRIIDTIFDQYSELWNAE